ncbi:HlyD family efflux transporter periplasmic adaptor subunit [uncultured Ruminococcus sp.]|uniref:HlyD family efflux transporter periplasmic adaptor subunit n=1 Tax=uncultured Ruminococcus sp. TaxID=165186 RepID=UPI0026020308|nr:HlyD family efflux transporter periplasmic adaptor subunit [uncultured Ruminococcus sp.]
MNSSNKMNNVLLVLLSASVLVTIGTIFYHFVDTSYETETAIRATADESKIFEGVYVRDETVLTYSGTGAVSYQVPDGGKVAVGDVIAEIYPDEGSIEQKQQIAALQEKLDVLERISNPGTLAEAQPADLSRQISQYYKEIVQNRDRSDISAMASAEQKLVEAYSTYQIVVSQGEVSFAQQISDLSAQIQSLESAQTQSVGTVTSENSSYFVSYTDGLESSLTVEKLSDITPEQIKKITQEEKNSGDTKTAQNNGVIGKSIAQYGWYMVGLIDNKEQKYKVGDTVTLKLLTSSAKAKATIQELRSTDEDGKVMVVLYCDTMTSDFVQNRTENVEMILGEYEGIKVPRDAIRFKDVEETVTDEETGEETTQMVNSRGVYVQDGEKIEFRRLDVIYEGKDYVLSDMNAGDGYLMLYDSIIVEGIDANGN